MIYAGARSPGAAVLSGALATTLHDHAISDALDDATAALDPHDVVGIMGGHALSRTDPAYAAAARLGAALTGAGRTVLTGGGPGAMEAGGLGAYLSRWPDALAEALAMLGAVPGYHPDLDAWVASAYTVRGRWPADQAGASLSIPTWFYGHEPSNLFATGIAKYFGQRAARGHPVAPLPRRHRLPARAGRNGAGDLPGGDRELLRSRSHPDRPAGAGRSGLLDRPPARLAPAAAAGRATGRWPTSIHCVDDIDEAADLLTALGHTNS